MNLRHDTEDRYKETWTLAVGKHTLKEILGKAPLGNSKSFLYLKQRVNIEKLRR